MISLLTTKLCSDMEERHAWLPIAAEQIRRWREEDARNGIEWNTSSREAGFANNGPASNHGN